MAVLILINCNPDAWGLSKVNVSPLVIDSILPAYGVIFAFFAACEQVV